MFGDHSHSLHSSNGQWQYGHGTDQPRSDTASSTYRNYSPDPAEVVSNVSEKMLETNGHFLCAKMVTEQMAVEITRLQEVVATHAKENNNLKVKVKTLKFNKDAVDIPETDSTLEPTPADNGTGAENHPANSDDEDDTDATGNNSNTDNGADEMNQGSANNNDDDEPEPEVSGSQGTPLSSGSSENIPDLPLSPSSGTTPNSTTSTTPSVDSTHAEGTTIHTTTPDTSRLETCTTPNVEPETNDATSSRTNDNVQAPQPNDTPTSLHSDQATASESNKHKANGLPSASLSKKQKKVNMLAEPTTANSIRNVCMHHWNETQPGGHGLLVNFDSHFKSLLDADKEPLKTEVRILQTAVRKSKAAMKKATITPAE
ncbi:hypothetical protein EI94DRAFT_1816742 [Lactarius quietus]|nr:hypothetical protein EI94DRAFT_1816742 [Lactarius quietus]